MRKFFAKKSFYKELIIITLPIAIQQLISSSINIIDTIMVSAYYESASVTSALAMALRYYNSFNMLMLSFAVGIGIYIAQFHGAKNNKRLKQVFGLSLIFCGSISLIAFSVGFFGCDHILRFFLGMSNDSEKEMIFNYGRDYLKIISFAFLVHGITNSLVFAFRPVRMTKIPLYSSIGAATINALLNYVLIFGVFFTPLGIKGVALTTVISRIVELAIVLGYYFWKKPPFYGSFKEIFVIPWHLVKEVVKKCRVLFLSQIITEGVSIFMLFVYFRTDSQSSSAGVAAISISQQITDLVMVFVAGMGTAASVLIGSRLGENKIEEARENARYQLTYVLIFGIFAHLFMIALIPFATIIFKFNENEIKIARIIIFMQALGLPFSVFSMNVIFIMRSGGYTKISVLVNNVLYLGVKVPLIALLLILLNPKNMNVGFINFFSENQSFFGKLILFSGSRLQISAFMSFFNSLGGFLIFIFMVDRFIEILRAVIALIIYKKVKWYNNLAISL